MRFHDPGLWRSLWPAKAGWVSDPVWYLAETETYLTFMHREQTWKRDRSLGMGYRYAEIKKESNFRKTPADAAHRKSSEKRETLQPASVPLSDTKGEKIISYQIFSLLESICSKIKSNS